MSELIRTYLPHKWSRVNATLNTLLREGYVKRVVSPSGELCLYTYTPKTRAHHVWNHHTVRARGHVYNINSGVLVAKPFAKFFNFDEHTSAIQDTLFHDAASRTSLDVFEKVDGSLGIVYFYAGQWHVNTRDSFTSPQARYATSLLHTHYHLDATVYHSVTLMVEIVYPWNLHPIDSKLRRELVLLGAYDIATRDDYTLPQLRSLSFKTGLPLPKQYAFASFRDVIAHQSQFSSPNGVVVRFRKHNYRVKVKSLAWLHFLQNRYYHSIVHNRLDRLLHSDGTLEVRRGVIPEEIQSNLQPRFQHIEHLYATIRADILHYYHHMVRPHLVECTPADLSRVLHAQHTLPKQDWRVFFLLVQQKPIHPVVVARVKASLKKKDVLLFCL